MSTEYNEGFEAGQRELRASCPMHVRCSEHDYFHGAEATELREGIEKLIKESFSGAQMVQLQRLLDQVDARDSLAYAECAKTQG